MDDDSISMVEAQVLLGRALTALVCGDLGALDLFTDDVAGDAPHLIVSSRTELEHQLIDRTGVLSNVDLRVERLEADGPDLVASWSMSGDHTGALLVDEDELFEPSGRRIEVVATTRARFRGRRVCAFRTTYDGDDLITQLRAGPLPRPS